MALGSEGATARVTLRDVARVANVHPGTASRALNEDTRGLVNEETARRVLEAAAELGYRPNPIARGLKTNRSYTIGVLIPDLTNPLFPPILRGIEDRLEEGGYTPLMANTDNDPERERIDWHAMRARQVDGIVAATARRDHELLDELIEAGIPVVLVNRRAPESGVPSATADDRQGIRLSVEHLAALGHTRHRAHRGPARALHGPRPPRGLPRCDARARPRADPELIVVTRAFTEAEGARACAELLDRGGGPTAIAAANDLIALGLLRRLRRTRPQLPGRDLGRGLQRHALRRPLPAAAHHDPDSALRDRHGGRRAACSSGCWTTAPRRATCCSSRAS